MPQNIGASEMRVISCIVIEHNLWLVLLAAVVCIAGCFVTMRLLERALRTDGQQRSGWIFQTASAAGSSVWCTHFITILAYQPNAPVIGTTKTERTATAGPWRANPAKQTQPSTTQP